MHTGPHVSSWVWVDMIEVCKKHLRKPEECRQPGKEVLPAGGNSAEKENPEPFPRESRSLGIHFLFWHGTLGGIYIFSKWSFQILEWKWGSGWGWREEPAWPGKAGSGSIVCQAIASLPGPAPQSKEIGDSLQPESWNHTWKLTVYRKTLWEREFWDQSPQQYSKIPDFVAHSLGPDSDHFKHFKLAH